MKGLNDIIKERILILDGAMGTKIQTYGLTEADFRGDRFAPIDGQLKGNNDILSLGRGGGWRDDATAHAHIRHGAG